VNPPVTDIAALKRCAAELRGSIIEVSGRAGVPHLGSCLSCVDILATLYWGVLRLDPTNSASAERDRFLLSKGHAAPALFQVLAKRGFFPENLLDNYGEDGSLFAEHPPAHGVPGIEAATGSLGHGLPLGIGMLGDAVGTPTGTGFCPAGRRRMQRRFGLGSGDDGVSPAS